MDNQSFVATLLAPIQSIVKDLREIITDMHPEVVVIEGESERFFDNPITHMYDNMKFIGRAHRNYTIGTTDPSAYEEILSASKENGDFLFPVYMMDHSGVTFSHTPFGCPWDSALCGWIAIEDNQDSGKTAKEIRQEAESAIKDYDDYVNGVTDTYYRIAVRFNGQTLWSQRDNEYWDMDELKEDFRQCEELLAKCMNGEAFFSELQRYVEEL